MAPGASVWYVSVHRCTSFVGFVHLRNPSDLGGFYSILNGLMSQVSCFVASAIYLAHFSGADGGLSAHVNGTSVEPDPAAYPTANNMHPATNCTPSSLPYKMDGTSLFASVGALATLWTIALVCLLLTIKRKYVGTFFSLQTGYAYTQSFFLDHQGNDAKQAYIFWRNERQWRSIRDLVRQWALSLYATWMQLRPSWFTDRLRALIPDDFTPASPVQQADGS